VGSGALALGMARPGAALLLMSQSVTVVSFYSMRRFGPAHSKCQNPGELSSQVQTSRMNRICG
jgi:hypothetical protein